MFSRIVARDREHSPLQPRAARPRGIGSLNLPHSLRQHGKMAELPERIDRTERIRVAAAGDLGAVQRLLREYAESLEIDLSFQGFEAELSDPLSVYELVLLAKNGCVGLRRIDERTCEMKRLYVRPTARGTGLGRRLALGLIAEARARGYTRILLDTLPTMSEAQHLYHSLGFREIAPYRYNPVPNTKFLQLAL